MEYEHNNERTSGNKHNDHEKYNQGYLNNARVCCPPQLTWTGFHPARSTKVGENVSPTVGPSPNSPTFPIPQANRWDSVHAMVLRESASIPMILSHPREGEVNWTSRGKAIPARTRGWCTL